MPFKELNLEPGEAVNEGEGFASQTLLPAIGRGEQDQEPQDQIRSSPRLSQQGLWGSFKQRIQCFGIVVGDWCQNEGQACVSCNHQGAGGRWGGATSHFGVCCLRGFGHCILQWVHEGAQACGIHQSNYKSSPVQSRTKNHVWELVPRSSVPPGTKILPVV